MAYAYNRTPIVDAIELDNNVEPTGLYMAGLAGQEQDEGEGSVLKKKLCGASSLRK